jgi:hypothetical protein
LALFSAQLSYTSLAIKAKSQTMRTMNFLPIWSCSVLQCHFSLKASQTLKNNISAFKSLLKKILNRMMPGFALVEILLLKEEMGWYCFHMLSKHMESHGVDCQHREKVIKYLRMKIDKFKNPGRSKVQ